MKRLITPFCFVLLLFLAISCDSAEKINPDAKKDNNSQIELRTTSHFPNAVGEIVNGNPELTAIISDIKQNWSDFLLDKSGLSLDFDQLEIRTFNNRYYLHGTDFDTGTSAIELVVENGNIYEAMIDGGGKTVTCSGCTSTGPNSSGECDVKGNKDGWYCTSCSAGDCIKETTISFLTGGILEYSH